MPSRGKVVDLFDSIGKEISFLGNNGRIYKFLSMTDSMSGFAQESRREERVCQLRRQLSPLLEKRRQTSWRGKFFIHKEQKMTLNCWVWLENLVQVFSSTLCVSFRSRRFYGLSSLSTVASPSGKYIRYETDKVIIWFFKSITKLYQFPISFLFLNKMNWDNVHRLKFSSQGPPKICFLNIENFRFH